MNTQKREYPEMKTLAAYLSFYKINREKLSKKIGYCKNAIPDKVRGRSSMTLHQVAGIVKELNIPLEDVGNLFLKEYLDEKCKKVEGNEENNE